MVAIGLDIPSCSGNGCSLLYTHFGMDQKSNLSYEFINEKPSKTTLLSEMLIMLTRIESYLK